MRLFALSLALVGLAVLASDARADDWSFDSYLKQHNKSDWDGYGVGSMVHRKSVNQVNTPQMPAPQKQEMEEKMTLMKVTDEGYVIKVERFMMGQWQTSEKTEPKDKGWEAKIEEAGTGTLSIAGTDYECAKKKVKWVKGEETKEESVVWVHPEKGILKMEASKDGSSMETTVAKFDASWTVGEATIRGRELQMKVGSQMGPISGTVGISLPTPGSVITQDLKGGQGPMSISISTKLVAYVKK